jgi:cytochrome P450
MPFVMAIIKETLRIAPVGPLGLPRMTIEEDNLGGYFIPQGAQVIYNISGIHRNLYERPHDFTPERWLTSLSDSGYNKSRNNAISVASNEDSTSPQLGKLDILDGIYTFGQGRRLCPGTHLAIRELFLVTSKILSCYTIKSFNGQQLIKKHKFGLTVLPSPHVRMIVEPRVAVHLSQKGPYGLDKWLVK